MAGIRIVCARCTDMNHPSNRFCERCGLPLGIPAPDADAGVDALGLYEGPEPDEAEVEALLRDLAARSGFEVTPAGHGWCMVVPLPLDRKQAVYLGHAGTDPEGRVLVSLVSVCGPANDRDAQGNPPKVESKAVKGKNTDVTRVEVAGTYTDPFAGDGPKPNQRLLGAIVQTNLSGYFFKMVGPDKTVKAAEPAFDAMLKSIQKQ